MEFHYRTDKDGVNPINDTVNEVYRSDTAFVSNWITLPMTERIFPKVFFLFLSTFVWLCVLDMFSIY